MSKTRIKSNRCAGDIAYNVNFSLDELWHSIENFGIKRELLDPHDTLRYNTILDLYLAIKNRNSSTNNRQE